MEVQLTSDQQAFARRSIECGRLQSEQDAVRQALVLWEERERQRAKFLTTLDDARASIANGGGRTITPESMRGRARLLAELAASRGWRIVSPTGRERSRRYLVLRRQGKR